MIEIAATNGLVRAVVLFGIFAVVMTGALVAMGHLTRRLTVRGELQRLRQTGLSQEYGESLRSQATKGAWAQLATAVEASGLSLSDTNDQRLSVKLRQAGFSSPYAPRIFTLARLAMVFLLPGCYVLFTYSAGSPPSFFRLYVVGSLLAILGLYLPNLFVQARADRRREEIVNGFPDCLDLLLVCVESGLGIEAAMDRVGREMVLSQPLVAELLSITTLQLRAGASREEAFRRLAEAASVEEIRSFTTLLIQSDKLGTSIASTLRVYAAEMREKRRMRAEEKAHRLPVLISIPLVVCMLPVMIGVLMLPAAVRVVRQIIPLMIGG